MSQPITLPFRIKLLKALILIAFIAGFLFSPHLWASKERFFPVIRPFDIPFSFTFPYDALCLLFFIISGTFWIFLGKRWPGCIAIGCLLIELLQDQMRWQPWVYLYLLLLLPHLLRSGKKANEQLILDCSQWIFAGVYVWSGIHKLNANFIHGTFAQITHAFGGEAMFTRWQNAGYLIPLIEMGTGICLLSTRFRKAGLCAAIVIHIAILFYLSPMVLNHNSIVYPWNVAMILMALVLFGKTRNPALPVLREMSGHPMAMLPAALVWLFPILNLSGHWDHYLSFSLYSDKPSTYYIAIEESQIGKIDKRLQQYFVSIPGLQGGQLIDIDKWSHAELNVPFYPQLKSFKKLGLNFCHTGIAEGALLFLEVTDSGGVQKVKTFTCSELR